jgi:sugar phosphate isomerase/epimerase
VYARRGDSAGKEESPASADSAAHRDHLASRAGGALAARPPLPRSTTTVPLPDVHLGYCTNIHPGERWPVVRANLERYLVPVRERVASGRPFGVGLRLSGESARALGDPSTMAELGEFLRAHDLYVFTVNGFPYGPFHGRPVKEQVYLPDWLDPERLAYTDRLAGILASLLPEGLDGSISTVPGAFAPRVHGEDDRARMAAAMLAHVVHLVRLRESSGRFVALALEPEPCCFLETIAETVAFFEGHLVTRGAVAGVAAATGLDVGAAESAIREHLGVCLDACHMAVEFEDPRDALDALGGAGIRVAKMQVTAGLRARIGAGDSAALDALAAFADDVYLHQVVERRADGTLARHLDLPQALAAARAAEGRGAMEAREWRVHFHVPVFRERYGVFEGTQEYVDELLRLVRERDLCRHFEVETYTWDVLPEEFRREGIVAAIAREMEWTAARLPRAGLPQAGRKSEGAE